MKAAAAAALALLGLGGAIGPALAEDVATFATPATQPEQAVAVELPRFVPSTEPVATIAPVVEPAMDLVPTPEEIVEDIPDGVASWYGARFAGRKTASGERFDPSEYTAAHRTLPFGSRVVRINDRGPFHGGRVIDLSQAAAEDLGIRHAGKGQVELALLPS